MRQLLLIPDPRPLDERLGRGFFRDAPKEPGVYLMRDAAGTVLYVGKARNLQQRLRNYRIANPDRMPRRHLRLLRDVARIDFEVCSSEEAALEREAHLLRSLRPKYNRAGVWPGKSRFFLWRQMEERVEMTVADAPETGWRQSEPLGSNAFRLHRTLALLLWLATNAARGSSDAPAGWFHRGIPSRVAIHCGDAAEQVTLALAGLFTESPNSLGAWLESRFAARTHPFDRAVIAAGLETLAEFSPHEKIPDKVRTKANEGNEGAKGITRLGRSYMPAHKQVDV
ncbi:MAG: nucleotide excision repair endonuclease [Limisphaerales bacterium]